MLVELLAWAGVGIIGAKIVVGDNESAALCSACFLIGYGGAMLADFLLRHKKPPSR